MKTFIGIVFVAALSLASVACAHAGSLDASPPPAPAGEVVNLNTATERELVDLPGVGPAKAAAILAFRKKHGGFKRVEDLRKVKGFGRKTVAKLRPSLTVGPPASASSRTE